MNHEKAIEEAAKACANELLGEMRCNFKLPIARHMRALAESILRAESQRVDTLRQAAQAVVDRWETPLWKDAPHTATFIHALRDALRDVPSEGVPPAVIPVFDLDQIAWESIKDAASKSPWMPPEYMMNDWVADVVSFLTKSADGDPEQPKWFNDLPQPVEPAASETPLTDARVSKMTGMLKEDEFIPADFARDLERRLRAAEAEREELRLGAFDARVERDAALDRCAKLERALKEYQNPARWILESAEWRWIPDPHLSFVNPQDLADTALQP